jgi:hypothetical protein
MAMNVQELPLSNLFAAADALAEFSDDECCDLPRRSNVC